jgi:hypothetical protein
MLYKRLSDKLTVYETAHQRFRGFFDTVLEVLLEDAHMRIARILEWSNRSSDDRPISLRLFLCAALESIDALKHCSNREARKQLQRDLHWASPKNTTTIKKLRDFRNNALGHIGRRRLSEKKRTANFLKYESRSSDLIDELYCEVGDKIKKYNKMIYGRSVVLWDENIMSYDEDELIEAIEKSI